MDIMEAIKQRHSVRSYLEKPLPESVIKRLEEEIARCNEEGHLHIQLVLNEDDAFDGFMAHYGKFSGVRNYIALIGSGSSDLDERAGYYGERLVLLAQMLGLNTCWVAMTFKKGAVKRSCEIAAGEKLACVIAIGYGTTQGVSHKVKSIDEVCNPSDKPDWFIAGVKAALLAPTAMNQQRFLIDLIDGKPSFKATGGFYSKIDLGIVKYHFELGASRNE